MICIFLFISTLWNVLHIKKYRFFYISKLTICLNVLTNFILVPRQFTVALTLLLHPKEPRVSAAHLLTVRTSKCALWDGSEHSCQPGCWYLNQHREGRMIWLGVWGRIYAWEVGAVGWGTTCWVSKNSEEGLWGSSLALCHVLQRHNELHYNYNTGWTQKEQNRYLSRGWKGLSHWDFGLRERSFTLFNAIAH